MNPEQKKVKICKECGPAKARKLSDFYNNSTRCKHCYNKTLINPENVRSYGKRNKPWNGLTLKTYEEGFFTVKVLPMGAGMRSR